MGSGEKSIISILSNAKVLIKYFTSNINSIRIEASSKCQLKCPICPTGKGLTKSEVIGWGHLKFENFKDFIDKNPSIKNIELSNWGEIFLNPELKDIIRYAAEKNIALSAGNGGLLCTNSHCYSFVE